MARRGSIEGMKFIKKYRFILLALLVIVIAAVAYQVLSHRKHPYTTTIFHAEHFSFSYSTRYQAEEYAPDVISVGYAVPGGFDPHIEVVNYQSDPQSPLPKGFQAFVKQQAFALCGSDGPIESISCSQASSTAYTSPTGIQGQELHLTLVKKNLATATTSSESYGPFYVFDTTATSTTDRPFRYSALFVYPSLADFLQGTTTPDLMQQIMGTLTIDGVPS